MNASRTRTQPAAFLAVLNAANVAGRGTSTESRRLDLYNGLQEVLGTERATTLMTYLPSIESPDLLTRSEFKAEMSDLKTDLKAEMSDLKTELRAEMSGLKTELRAEMGELRDGLRAEMGDVEDRLRAEMGVLGGGLRAEMGVLEGGLRAEMRELTKRMDRVLLAVVGGLFVILAAVFTSAAVL